MQVNLLRRLYWYVRGFFLILLGIFIRKRLQPNLNQVKRILIITLFRIGDSVYATPVLREVKRQFPDVVIDLVCCNYTAAVFQNNPNLRNIFILKNGLFEFLRLIRVLQKKKYDLVIDLTADDKIAGALIARLSNASYCLGYNIYKRGFLLDRAVPLPKGELHATQIFLNLLEELGIPVHSNQPEIFITDNEEEETENLLKKYAINKHDFVIGLHPGANFSSQRLSEKKWALLCDSIQEKFGKKVVICGGPKDLQVIKSIHEQALKPVIAIDELPDLRATIALIGHCDILLCNNSGPLHIAEALGTPTLSWMGPTIPYRWYPIGPLHQVIRKEVDCAPCNRGVCKHHTCETLITVDDLEEALKNLIKEISDSGGAE